MGSNTVVSGTTVGASTYLNMSITPVRIEAGDATITLVVTNANGLTSLATFNVTASAEEEKLLPQMAIAVIILAMP
jgi:hypothetical protein